MMNLCYKENFHLRGEEEKHDICNGGENGCI